LPDSTSTQLPFMAEDIMCTASDLDIGGTITCTTPTFTNANTGKQFINVAVSSTSSCSGSAESAVAQAKWYTPIVVPVTPGGTPSGEGGSSSSGDSGSGEGDSGSGEGGGKATGCDSTFWATCAASNYPSYWTPNTPFYKAAGLSKDPLSGQSLQDVLQSTGDGLNAFYRASACALLNSATVPGFGLSKWEVQSRIESALSRYFRSGSRDTSSCDLWRKQFDSWSRPCN